MRIPPKIFLCRFFFWIALLLPLSRSTAEDRSFLVNRNDLSVLVGGRPAPREIRMQEGPVQFNFVAPQGGANSVERFSFKLEGCDLEWRERASGGGYVMRVAVQFYDKGGDLLSHTDFGVTGNSPGWTGDPENSPLTHRNEHFAAPKGATALSVMISSAGPPQQVGTLAVSGLVLSTMAGNSSVPLINMEFPVEDGAKTPAGWNRSGPHASIAHVVFSKMAPGGRLLALKDEDILSHGEWQSGRVPIDIAAGGVLRMEWLQNYSIGIGGNLYLSYPKPEPGRHLFRFRKLTPHGVSTNQEGEIALIIVPPFWKRTWFLVIVEMVTVGVAIGSIRFRSWQQTRFENAALRKKNVIQAERERIARDLHDTLEQGLTVLSLQIQCIAHSVEDGPPQAAEPVEAARRVLQQCHTELRDSIWNLRTAEVEQIDLGVALKRMAESLAAGLNIQIELQQETNGVKLPFLVENNLLRIAQESITNAIKNAGASRVALNLFATSSQVTLEVSDNGPGFSVTVDSLRTNGHFGILGMQERTQSMGGHLTISTGESGGGVIHVEVPLQASRKKTYET